MTVHIVDALTDEAPFWINVAYISDTRTLCDKPCRTWREGVVVETLATIAIDSPTIRQSARKPKVPKGARTLPGLAGLTDRERTVCAVCLNLARMPTDARTQAIAARDALKKARFAELGAKTKAKKAAERAELIALIERTRPDAMACYDGWLSEPPIMLQRCTWELTSAEPNEPRACLLPFGHALPHRLDVEPAPDLNEVLEVALRAFKLEHRGGGDRLWVFRDRESTEAKRARGYKVRRPNIREVVCRFCDETLGTDQTLGNDYTNYTFYPDGLRHSPTLKEIPGPRAPGSTPQIPIVNVRRHTVECALRWLAKIEPRQGLPEDSFVLAMDDDGDQPEASP